MGKTFTCWLCKYREKSDLWATLSDFGPPCFPATWPAKVCHHGSIILLPRQVAQNRTKLCGPPIWLLFTRLQVSNWVNFVLWIFCIFYWTRKHFFLIFYSCDFPNKLITNLSTIKQKGKIGFFTVYLGHLGNLHKRIIGSKVSLGKNKYRTGTVICPFSKS